MTAYTDFHYSPTGSGVISGAQVLEQTEQGINGLGQYVQDNVSGAIDTANQALTIAQTADSNATLALNTANSFASAISAANNTANNALTTAQSAQNTANTASSLATTANNNANTALNAANTATANVGTLTNSVNALGNRMTTAENAISTNAGNITTLQTNLQTTNNNVTSAANAASAAQATATSAQSTATLARNQAYVLRYTGTTITGGGTIAYADIDNTDNIKAGDKIIDATGAIYDIASVDITNQTVTVGASPVINLFCDAENLIPAANDAYDLGSASKQWLNTYSKGYYYNGVAWGLDKENVWTGENTFVSSFSKRNNAMTLGTTPAEVLYNSLFFKDKNNTLLASLDQQFNTDGSAHFVLRIAPNQSGATREGAWEYIHDGTNRTMTFNATLCPVSGYHALGTSTYQWKSLNGVNPGALSLPNLTMKTYDPNNGWYELDTTDWDLTGSPTDISSDVLKDGYLYICLACDSTGYVIICEGVFGYPNCYYSASGLPISGYARALLPVRRGTDVRIYLKGTSVYSARLLPALGNV